MVTGGGYTGLAIARRIAEKDPYRSIAIVEAHRVGQGASGRNSGFLMDLDHYQSKLGVEGNRRLVQLARNGIDHLRDIVQRNGIDCEWTECGRLHVSVEQIGKQSLDAFAQSLDKMAEPYEPLSADQIAEITGTEYYRHGLRVPGGAFAQPAALIRGLAKSLPSSVQLFENQPVKQIERPKGSKQPFRIRTADGVIVADKVVLATNGFTSHFGYFRNRVIPMLTFISMTRPLTPDEQQLGGQSQWGLVPEERMGSTVRRTADHRILIRNTVRYRRKNVVSLEQEQKIQRIHRKAFEARFPKLHHVPFEYSWGGVLGVTLNNTHCFGELEQNLYICAAYNGVGIAHGTALGAILGDLITGHETPLTDQALNFPYPAWLPPDPLLKVGLATYTGWLQRRAGAER